MRRIAAVTTCHKEGYRQYGQRMISTFVDHWPESVSLHVYAEDFVPAPVGPRVVHHDLHARCPDLVAFKERHADNPRAHGSDERPRWRLRLDLKRGKVKLRRKTTLGYRWDAVRFSHKVFAMLDAAERVATDVLIFLDADTYCVEDVPIELVEACVPEHALFGYLMRPLDAETGFVGLNLAHPAIGEFLAAYRAMYTTDALFKERYYCDGYLFNQLRRRFEAEGHVCHDIAQGRGREIGDVFSVSPLGRYMVHEKGARKHRVELVASV